MERLSLTKQLLIVAGVVALLMLAIFAIPVHAAPVPQYAIGVNGIWADDATYPSDIEAGSNASISLSPHVSLVGAAFYGFNRSYVRGSGGFRLTATDPNDPNFSIGLGGQYHVSSEESVRPQEFAVDASISYVPFPTEQPRVILIAQGQYGFAHNDAQVIAGIRYRLGR